MGSKRGSATSRRAKGGQQKKQKSAGFLEGPRRFIREVRGELRRVNWPNRDQLRQSTAVVLIIVVTLGVYVSAWDFIFQSLTRLIFAP